jgi:hypothetical protein
VAKSITRYTWNRCILHKVLLLDVVVLVDEERVTGLWRFLGKYLHPA